MGGGGRGMVKRKTAAPAEPVAKQAEQEKYPIPGAKLLISRAELAKAYASVGLPVEEEFDQQRFRAKAAKMDACELRAGMEACSAQIRNLQELMDRSEKAQKDAAENLATCFPEVAAMKGTPNYDEKVKAIMERATSDFSGLLDEVTANRAMFQTWSNGVSFSQIELKIYGKELGAQEQKLRILEEALKAKRKQS